MPDGDDYRQLLDATITHLEDLKRRGTRFVPADRQLLSELVSQQPMVARSIRPLEVAPTPVAPAVMPASQPSRPRSFTSPPSAPVPAETPTPVPVSSRAPATRTPLTPEEKEAAIASLAVTVAACTRCANLVAARKSVVFGVGSVHSPLMFVGEAPGAEEDVQGEPFVGAAGQLLTKIIKAMGLERETVYIANVLKCRPDTPGQSFGNRKPTAEEMKTCLPFLQEQVQIIAPKVIVALGATALEGLLGRSPVYITKERGRWLEYQGIAVMPTFHPSYVLRNQSPETKRQIWEDMLAVMERLGMEISAKQRGYYAKPA